MAIFAARFSTSANPNVNWVGLRSAIEILVPAIRPHKFLEGRILTLAEWPVHSRVSSKAESGAELIGFLDNRYAKIQTKIPIRSVLVSPVFY